MELDDFKLAIEKFTEKAEKIACALHGHKDSHIQYTTFDDDEAEVFFREDSGCGCCSDEEYSVCIPIDDLTQDVEKLVREKEQQRAESKRKKEEETELRKQKEKEAADKREKDNYERLRRKYESGA